MSAYKSPTKHDLTPDSRYKLAVRIWEPVLAKLNPRLEAAFLRRDAWLS